MPVPETKVIRPQEGFQEKFLASPADIVIGGGAAGAGKTFALLFEAVRHVDNPRFGAVFFRRTYPQITSEGGLWDTSKELYPYLRAEPKGAELEWVFPSGARVSFAHLQHEKNVFDWQGAQIPLICFDELTHFSESSFFYLLSRNRSTCGVRPYVRATCNPDPDSWVARFIEWYIDQETGFPIPERAGVLRYFSRDGNAIVWGNSPEEVLRRIQHVVDELPEDTDPLTLVKSFTFIPGTVYENLELLKVNPQYIGDLLAQDEATKAQLLEGNWKVKPDGDALIKYEKALDLFTNEGLLTGRRYISADVALHGSDSFVIFVWEGWRVVDVVAMPKTDGKIVEAKLREVARSYQVPISNIVYDADGVGAFLKGFLSTAYSFNNGGAPVKQRGENVNYKNLKSQCYYTLAKKINEGAVYISPKVAETLHGKKKVREVILAESRAIKQNKPDADGKLSVIPKAQMKNILGHSPDFLDALMMRTVFDLKPSAYPAPRVYLPNSR